MVNPALLFVLFGILVSGGVIWSLYAASERRKELAAWAHSRGLAFNRAKDTTLDDRFPDFDCLRRGHSRYGHNLIRGRWSGREFLGFDYHYVTGSGKNRQTHNFSAVVLVSDVLLRPLFIRPEGFFDKVGEFFGLDDIDFESAEFSREFYVKSADRRWAYDVIHARTMEFLLSAPKFHIEMDFQHVIAWRSSTFEPVEFSAAADVISGLLNRLPEYVVRRQKGVD